MIFRETVEKKKQLTLQKKCKGCKQKQRFSKGFFSKKCQNSSCPPDCPLF